MLARRTTPLQVECVARGYISGSGWKDYKATGEVCGIPLPKGMRESDRLPEPIFTPATKADSGHDENISEARPRRSRRRRSAGAAQDADPGSSTRTASRTPNRRASSSPTPSSSSAYRTTASCLLIDEMMTPDSSRYWPKDTYSPGGPQPSFDKQYVRDYLESIKWNKQPPVPSLPDDVVQNTREQIPGCVPPPDRPRTGVIARCISCSSSSSPRWWRRASATRMRSASSRSASSRRVVEKSDGNLGQGRRHARRAPQHAHPQDQGSQDQQRRLTALDAGLLAAPSAHYD